MPVAEGGRVAAVGCDPVSNVGPNGPVSGIIGIQGTGMNHGCGGGSRRNDAWCSATASGQGSCTDPEGFQFCGADGWRGDDGGASFDGACLEAVLKRVQRRPDRWSACECKGANGGQETCNTALLRVVGHHGNVRFPFEDLHGKHGQRTLWPDLNEHATACVVHGFDLLGPLDRGGHLRGELLQNSRFGIGPLHRVKRAVNVGGDRHRRPANFQPFQKPAKGFVGRRDDPRMEGVRSGEGDAREALLLKRGHGRFDGRCFTGDNGHLG